MPVTGFFDVPQAARYALRRVHVPAGILSDPAPGPVDQDDLVFCDLLIEDGKVAGLAPAGSMASELGPDLDRSLGMSKSTATSSVDVVVKSEA